MVTRSETLIWKGPGVTTVRQQQQMEYMVMVTRTPSMLVTMGPIMVTTGPTLMLVTMGPTHLSSTIITYSPIVMAEGTRGYPTLLLLLMPSSSSSTVAAYKSSSSSSSSIYICMEAMHMENPMLIMIRLWHIGSG